MLPLSDAPLAGFRPEAWTGRPSRAAPEGQDIVRNALALSGMPHRTFGHGRTVVAADRRILASHDKVPRAVTVRLIAPGQRLLLPDDPRDRPHPDDLRFDREDVFGRSAAP